VRCEIVWCFERDEIVTGGSSLRKGGGLVNAPGGWLVGRRRNSRIGRSICTTEVTLNSTVWFSFTAPADDSTPGKNPGWLFQVRPVSLQLQLGW
jgi:hypothetical protein